ncbi:hypothetical protein Tco_1159184 [Tanacetum coccineum]
MNDHLKAHRNFQQVMDDSMSKLCETFQTWLQQRQEQVVNLDTYTPEPSQYRKIPICYDDDDDEYSFATVEDLVHTPSESDGISESECDLPIYDDSSPKKDEVLDDIISIPPGNDIRFIEYLMYDNSFPRPPETLKDDSETIIDSNNDYSSSDDDSPYSEDIDYVDALPPDLELVSLEVVNLLIAKIEALKDNPTPSYDFVTKSPSTSSNAFLEETDTSDNSLPGSETFCFNLEEKSSGNPTSYTDLSLPDYEAFFCDSEPDSGDFTMDVVEDIFDNPTREPRVHVPNVLPTHPTLQLDSDFTLSMESKPRDFYQRINFLSHSSVILLFPVINTLLPFSSENEDKVVNPGILAAGEEKSPHLLSHRGFKAFQLISESPIMISRGDIPILDVPFLHFYPPWPAQVWGSSQAQDSVNKNKRFMGGNPCLS